jgi:hypothetical protein
MKSAAVFLVIFGAMVALRWPLYLESRALLLGWNSDTAIYGLMAREMVETRSPIFLFWGQDYLGTLTSAWTLAAAIFTGGVGPVALRIGAAAQIAVAVSLFAWVLLRAWGKAAATVAVLWLIAGPRWFFEMTYAPLSADMFFMGALILWYANRQPFTRIHQWLILGILGGAGWWAHRGSMFALLPAVVTIVVHDDSWRVPQRAIRAVAAGIAGGMLGLLPLLAGYAQITQRLYEPVTNDWSVFEIASRVVALARTDLWLFLVGSKQALDVACAVVVLVLMAIGARGAGVNRSGFMLIGVVMVMALFWLTSPQAYSGATRYLMLALPVVYALAGRGAAHLFNVRSRLSVAAATVALCAISINLYSARIADVAAISAAKREDHYQWKSFDPRPALAAIDRGGYSVCYADFWVAYKLEWLSESGVKFIPHRSVNRTQKRSLMLADLPVTKCFVSSDGTVRRLSPEEERVLRAFLRERVLSATSGST